MQPQVSPGLAISSSTARLHHLRFPSFGSSFPDSFATASPKSREDFRANESKSPNKDYIGDGHVGCLYVSAEMQLVLGWNPVCVEQHVVDGARE